MPEILIWKIKTSLALQARREQDERISQSKLLESIKWNAIQKQVEEYLRYGTRLPNTIKTEMHVLYNECLILLEIAIMNHTRRKQTTMQYFAKEVIEVICAMRPIWFYIEDHATEQTQSMAIQFLNLMDTYRSSVLNMRETAFYIFILLNNEQDKYFPKRPYVTHYELQGNMDVPHYSIFTNSLYQWLLERQIRIPNIPILPQLDAYEMTKSHELIQKELSEISTLPIDTFISLLKNTDVPSTTTLYQLPMGFNVHVYEKEKDRDNATRLKLFMNLFFSSHRRTQNESVLRQKLIRVLYKIGNDYPHMLPIHFPMDMQLLKLNLPQLIQAIQKPDSPRISMSSALGSRNPASDDNVATISSLDMKNYGKRQSRKKKTLRKKRKSCKH
jgi:hypothetical protein